MNKICNKTNNYFFYNFFGTQLEVGEKILQNWTISLKSATKNYRI